LPRPYIWSGNNPIEIHTLSGGEYALLGEFTADETLESKLLAGISIVIGSLFAARD